jgi:hypothetical protein
MTRCALGTSNLLSFPQWDSVLFTDIYFILESKNHFESHSHHYVLSCVIANLLLKDVLLELPLPEGGWRTLGTCLPHITTAV